MSIVDSITSKTLGHTDKAFTSVSYTVNREEDHRTRFEQSIKDLLKIARSYYETNRKINLIVVGVGLVFLANAIAHTWIRGVDSNDNAWLSLASGGLSVATFVTLFFTKSQENITKAFGNLTQIQMIYKAFCLQFDALLDFHLSHEDDEDLSTINNMNIAAGSVASNAATLVQDNIENEKAEITETKSEIKTNGVNTAAATVESTTNGDVVKS